jgi:hypothetical protein
MVGGRYPLLEGFRAFLLDFDLCCSHGDGEYWEASKVLFLLFMTMMKVIATNTPVVFMCNIFADDC